MGGMERHVAFLASGYVRRGLPTALVCSDSPDIEPLRRSARDAGVDVRTVPTRSGVTGLVVRARHLFTVLRHYRGAVVHLHSTGFHGGDLAMLVARAARAAAVVRTEHVPPQPPLGLRHRVAVRCRDRLLVSKVICVSRETRAEHVRLLDRDERKLVTIPNGIDVDAFRGRDRAAARRRLGVADDEVVVGTVARLAEDRKGIDEFLEMSAGLAAGHPACRFWIAGDGPLRGRLEARATSLGVADRVRFLGERDDVADVLAALDVFVMPSWWESGPLTLLEAMAVARPVVTTSVGIAPDAVTDGHDGLIVPPRDVAALTAAVDRLLSDADLAERLAEEAGRTAERSFSIDLMVDRTLDLYRSLLVADR